MLQRHSEETKTDRTDIDSDNFLRDDISTDSSDSPEILRKLRHTAPHQPPTLTTNQTLTRYTIPATPGNGPANNSDAPDMDTTTPLLRQLLPNPCLWHMTAMIVFAPLRK
mmetsp:Transcript_116745/g.238841  ORF Transcript_116745/g.238841 Transcript_116745/m.238841 type:complete len:110 (-) Transcript_116745:23-352(-)